MVHGSPSIGLQDTSALKFSRLLVAEDENFQNHHHHVEPNIRVSLMNAMKSCGKEKDLHKARWVHEEVLRNALFPNDIYVSNGLVSMYAKCGLLIEAQEVFDKILRRDVVSWNALISGFIQRNLGHEAWKCYFRMLDEGISPNVVTFVCILKACGTIGSLPRKEAVHVELIQFHGLLDSSVVLGNALVDMYIKCGMLGKAKEVFDNLPQHDAVSWNSLIAGYARNGLNDEAFKCFKSMQDEGLSPDAITFLCMLKACTNVRSLEIGEEIHAVISRQGLLEKNIMIGNALIDMYGKCGMLDKAARLFEELPKRDVISWNALITGYVQHGFNIEALNYFKRIYDESVSPNQVTFVCVLKACARSESLDIGVSIHDEISKRRLLHEDIVLATALVDMYARCGALGKAQEVFDGIPERNVVTWNALIGGYAQHGWGNEALKCFRQMQGQGIFPDAITFTSMLKTCSRLAWLELGEEIHTEIIKLGLFKKYIIIGNALIDMYVKCGMLERAKEVFEELPRRNVISWNSLIVGYNKHGLCEKAIECFREMRAEGLSPDPVAFICILKACASIGSLEMGEEIHSEVTKHSQLKEDIILGNALLDMYIKCGAPRKAQEVFDQLLVRDAVAWNALISGYTQHELHNEALHSFRHMQDEGLSPNVVTFVCTLKACGSLRSLQVGEDIYAEVTKQGLLGKDAMLGTALVDMYAKCGALEKARKVCEELPFRDAGSWNALITGYSQHGLDDEALSCFIKMQVEGTSPNAITYVCTLKACANIGSLKIGEQVHSEVSKQGLIVKDIVLGTSLMDMYTKCGVLHKAREVFNELHTRNVVAWNVLIAGYTQHGSMNEALACFKQMHDEGVYPDVVTFISIVNACGNVGLLEIGEAIHVKLKEGLLVKEIVLGTALVDMYAKCGLIGIAEDVFNELNAPNVVSYNALISGYAHHGQPRKVLEILNQMKVKGVSPNSITFLGLLTACSHAGLVDEGQIIFRDIDTEYRLDPNLGHYVCMVDLFSRVGHFNKALLMIQSTPSSNHLSLWLTFLGGCLSWVNVEAGLWAFKQAIKLDDKCAIAYVYMGNIYASHNIHMKVPHCVEFYNSNG